MAVLAPTSPRHLFISLAAILSIIVTMTLACKRRKEVVDASDLHTASLVEGVSFRDILRQIVFLSTVSPELVSVEKYGESIDKNPLIIAKIGLKDISQDLYPRPVIFISEAIHGDEYLNIAVRVMEKLVLGRQEHKQEYKGFDQFIKSGGMIYLAPVVNPDGFIKKSRFNANGIDLNRDFPTEDTAAQPTLTQPETKALANHLEQELKDTQRTKLLLTMDYHCCLGTIFWGKKLDAAFGANKGQIETRDKIDTLIRSLFYYAPSSQFPTVANVPGTSDDYFYQKYGALGFIFEARTTPANAKLPHEERGTDEDKRLSKHVEMWERLFAGAVANPPFSSIDVQCACEIYNGTCMLIKTAGGRDAKIRASFKFKNSSECNVMTCEEMAEKSNPKFSYSEDPNFDPLVCKGKTVFTGTVGE